MEIETRVRIAKNIHGNDCEPFIGAIGSTTIPFYKGCRKAGWVGVILDFPTTYGNKFNFHEDELEVLEQDEYEYHHKSL